VALTLRVTSFHSQALGSQGTKTFGNAGGSIGRNQGNDWVLPDPEKFISGKHCVVTCRNGNYYLSDVSTNGTFVNGSTQPIGNGMEQPLREGDRVQIGEYEFAVSIDRAEQSSVTGPTGFNLGGGGGFSTGPSVPRHPTAPNGLGGFPQHEPGRPVSPDSMGGLFGAEDPSWQRPPPNDPRVFSDHAPTLEQHFMPPPIERPPAHAHSQAPSGIPDNWDTTEFGQSSMPPAPAMPPPMAPPPMRGPVHGHAQSPHAMGQGPQLGNHTGTFTQQMPALSEDQAGAFVSMLVAAGLDPAAARMAAATPGVHAVVGKLLAVAVQGMLEVLKARAEIKSTFRVAGTLFGPAENNPLKFSANGAQALRTLFTANNQAYLDPVGAFAEGFNDIKVHQIAMMAGMRAAFDSMLQRFNPDELAERFEKRLKRAVLNMPGKGRYWELYRDLYEEWTEDADLNFQRLFGETFAQAYEEQMRRLTSMRR
jgi:type VI secretion system FHA domain protein